MKFAPGDSVEYDSRRMIVDADISHHAGPGMYRLLMIDGFYCMAHESKMKLLNKWAEKIKEVE